MPVKNVEKPPQLGSLGGKLGALWAACAARIEPRRVVFFADGAVPFTHGIAILKIRHS